MVHPPDDWTTGAALCPAVAMVTIDMTRGVRGFKTLESVNLYCCHGKPVFSRPRPIYSYINIIINNNIIIIVA